MLEGFKGFKGLTFYAIAGLLGAAPACIIVTDDDDTEGDDGNAETGNATDTGNAETGSATAAETSGTPADSGSTAAETGADASTAADETGSGRSCGWGPTGDPAFPEGYVCGGNGEDPDGNFPLACPEDVDLQEGAACGGIEGQGCCDTQGNAWFCGDGGNGPVLVLIPCN